MLAVGGVRDFAVWQAIRQRADFADRAAGAGLARQRERAVTGGRNLARQQMQIVDQILHPRAARMLIDAHAPERHHLLARIAVHRREPADIGGGNADQFLHFFGAYVASRLA